MSLQLSITETNIFTVLRSFILTCVAPGVAVVRGQTNRVSQPSGSDYVEITPLFQERMLTNIDEFVPCLFTGSISGTTLTVSDMPTGSISVGDTVFASGVTAGTTVSAFGSGTGGIGTYTVNNSQSVGSSPMQAGTRTLEQDTQVSVQVDCYGPTSADYAQTITTLFRDEYACTMFEASGFNMDPLYTSDPRQAPFSDSNQQIEEHWHFDAVMQVNPVLTIPQQFAEKLEVTSIHDVI